MKKLKFLGLVISIIALPAIYGFTLNNDAYAWFYLLKHKTGNEASHCHKVAFEQTMNPVRLSKKTLPVNEEVRFANAYAENHDTATSHQVKLKKEPSSEAAQLSDIIEQLNQLASGKMFESYKRLKNSFSNLSSNENNSQVQSDVKDNAQELNRAALKGPDITRDLLKKSKEWKTTNFLPYEIEDLEEVLSSMNTMLKKTNKIVNYSYQESSGSNYSFIENEMKWVDRSIGMIGAHFKDIKDIGPHVPKINHLPELFFEFKDPSGYYFQDLRIDAKDGVPWAQYEYGMMMLNGSGIQCDIDRGVKLLEKSEKQGYEKALFRLIDLAILGIVKINQSQFDKAVELKYPPALNSKGEIYLGKKEYVKAFKYFKESAAKNYAPAQVNLAGCYLKGWGVEIDNKYNAEVILLMKKAARNGEVTAQKYLNNLLIDY